MCNNSVFQQQRRIKQLEEITGFKFVKKTQINPRKFEIVMEINQFGDKRNFYIYFGDEHVTFKEVGVRSPWYIFN